MENKIPRNFIADKLQIKREIYNPNPKQKNDSGYDRTDCVIRTFCKMTGKTWKEIFDSISKISMYTCRMPTSDYVIKIFLGENKWRLLSQAHYNCQNIAMFMSAMKCMEMDFIIIGGGHMCFYSNGVWYDNKYCFEFATDFLICKDFEVYMRDSDINRFIEFNKNRLESMIKVEKSNGEKLEIAVNTLKAVSTRLSNGDDYMNGAMIDSIKAIDNALKMIGGI